MQEEFKHIKLELGDVSLKEQLGIYYIDMRPAMVHYTENIYGGGFDEEGIPMVLSDGEKTYFPINIAQFGFMIHARYLADKNEKDLLLLKKIAQKLLDISESNDQYVFWKHNSKSDRFHLSSGWTSAMAQGECISFFLRYYQISNEEKYLEASKKAFNFLHEVKTRDGGARNYDRDGNLWLEEYPTPEPYGPSCVLNGFIYAIFGLYDFYRVTKNEKAKQDIDACITTLKRTLHKFNVGYWSLYDLHTKELVRYYYQKNVHTPQMEILYKLTGEAIFLKYKNKWGKTVNPINYTFVQIMYRILPRWRKLWNKK